MSTEETGVASDLHNNGGPEIVHSEKPQSLDEKYYSIDDEALGFMQTLTGIEDPDELKKHIVSIQAEAYAIYPYPCIRRFAFLSLKLGHLPAYQELIALGKSRKDAVLLDIGCCFGNDLRKAVSDGYPIENCIASDLHPEYWTLGHKLFKSTQESFPVPFIPGDVFDPKHIETVPPIYSPPDTPLPKLTTLTSLNPLQGHVSAIHASAFFHLFDEEQQFKIAKTLAGLLSPEPGSMILGEHSGLPEKGLRQETPGAVVHYGRVFPMFCHGPESWREMWDGQVFKKGTVKVDVVLTVRKDQGALSGIDAGRTYNRLTWSVTRL